MTPRILLAVLVIATLWGTGQANAIVKCSLWGDPHYKSWDGKRFDFQGNCKYVLVTSDCGSEVSQFTIEIEQVLTSWGSPVAVSKAFCIRVNGNHYRLRYQQQFFVSYIAYKIGNNGVPTAVVGATGTAGLTEWVNADVKVTVQGATIAIELVGLNIKLTWSNNHHAVVEAADQWYAKLCGLCGSNNGDASDDFTGKDTVVYTTAGPFGDTWQVTPGPPQCAVGPSATTSPCDDDKITTTAQKTVYEQMCAKLSDGEFSACAAAIRPSVLAAITANCMTELCDCGQATNLCMCTTREELARYCEANQQTVAATWRDTFDCDGICIMDGVARAEGTSWVQGENVCTCTDGVLAARPNGKDTCGCWGDPHYWSFDGTLFDFQGDCKYVMVKDCDAYSFIIEIDHIPTSVGSSVTMSKSFTIEIGGDKFHLHWGQKYSVGGGPKLNINTPYTDPNNKVTISKTGATVTVVLINLKVTLSWSSNHRAVVEVDHATWDGKLCGLCGINNGDQTDDFTGRDLVVYVQPNPFGDTWLVPGADASCTATTPTITPCQGMPDSQVAAAVQACKVLISPEFMECADIDMGVWMDICMTEMCDCGVYNRMCTCTTIEALAMHCQRIGKSVGDYYKRAFTWCNDICFYGTMVKQHGSTWTDGDKECKCDTGVVTCGGSGGGGGGGGKRCPTGWVTSGDRCFLGQSCRARECSPDDARRRCDAMGAKVARVLTVEDGELFVSSVFGFSATQMFVEGRDEDTEGTWVYGDGTALAFSTFQGQNKNDKDCVYVTTNGPGSAMVLVPVTCDGAKKGKKWGFVCEIAKQSGAA